MTLPEWKLPPGVARGTWDYANSTLVAEDYDDYHALNPLFEFEESILAEEFNPPGVVADFGCGTGRALVPLVRRGCRGIAVDLSEKMLAIVREKAGLEGLAIECVQANLVELDALASESADYGMCLFSTLGMIRGRKNRAAALAHMRRVLRPGGKLVLHVHNLWFNLHDPGGAAWILRGLGKTLRRSDWELGDKYFPYRGVPNFFLHVFRRRELRRDLRKAGFRVTRWVPLDVRRRHALRAPWLVSFLRANGWIVVCQRS
ncbi:MAG: class I SAM-dependent methyltransferase [Planctomycetales bacterium]|nr:class I SAM-dependent methyltransferase [Planctomycetales bacterium]